MKNLEMPMTEIFGIVDSALDRLEAGGRTVERKKSPNKPVRQEVPTRSRKAQQMPKLKVKNSTVPKEMKDVEVGNVVYVPDTVLKELAKSLNTSTGKLNNLLLQSLMPLLLSYQTSTNYARAALKEGLDVEVDFDPGLADCIKHIGYLTVVMHFIRQSKLPLSVKRRFIGKFSDKLAERAIEAMIAENLAQENRIRREEHLQAVVYSRQGRKMEVKTPNEKPTDKKRRRVSEKPVDTGKTIPTRTGVRRSRSD